MAHYDCMDLKAYFTTAAEAAWETISEGFRVKRMLTDAMVGTKCEYYVGLAELDPGAVIGPQKTNLALYTHILEGTVWARLGRQRVELEKTASNYFPIGKPWSYENRSSEKVVFLYTFACDNEVGQTGLKIEPCTEAETRAYFQPNCPTNLMNPAVPGTGCRWATAGDTDPWTIVEAAQGSRSQTFQGHFDEGKGNKEMWWGLCSTNPNCRYSPHFHTMSEIFYIVSGEGTMYGGSEVVPIKAGSLVYLPSKCMHGLTCDGNSPLIAVYACEIEQVGTAYDREEIVDVPICPPADRHVLLLSENE